jgi:hypothetical protein
MLPASICLPSLPSAMILLLAATWQEAEVAGGVPFDPLPHGRAKHGWDSTAGDGLAIAPYGPGSPSPCFPGSGRFLRGPWNGSGSMNGDRAPGTAGGRVGQQDKRVRWKPQARASACSWAHPAAAMPRASRQGNRVNGVTWRRG